MHLPRVRIENRVPTYSLFLLSILAIPYQPSDRVLNDQADVDEDVQKQDANAGPADFELQHWVVDVVGEQKQVVEGHHESQFVEHLNPVQELVLEGSLVKQVHDLESDSEVVDEDLKDGDFLAVNKDDS